MKVVLLSNVITDYSHVSILGESRILGMHDCGEMFHLGQQGPGRTVITLFRNLEWWKILAG